MKVNTYQSIPSQHYEQTSRLPRIHPLDANENEKSINEVNDMDTCYSNLSIATKMENSVNDNVEEQKHQLFGICEMIQNQLKGALERINKIVRWIETNNGMPSDFLEEYRQRAWPTLVETDTQTKLLSYTVRHIIDSCSLNERCLDWLLAIHKFQVGIEEMISTLTTTISDDIERVLELRVRSCHGGLIGLRLKKETTESIQNMQKEIRTKTFRE